MPNGDPWYILNLRLGARRIALPLGQPEVQAYGGPVATPPAAAVLHLQAQLQLLYDRLSPEEQHLLAAVLSQAATGYGVVDEPGSLSAVMTVEGIVVYDGDGTMYAIPQELRAQGRVLVASCAAGA